MTNVFTWNGEEKPIGGGFIGTPPELDMAVFTVCALIRSDQYCPAEFNGVKFSVEAFINIFKGHQTIGSSYPVFE